MTDMTKILWTKQKELHVDLNNIETLALIGGGF